jgi:N-6 DNA Methylase
MARLRRNEWNFSSNAAELITSTLRAPDFAASPLGHAEAELTELRGARRLDLVIFGRRDPQEPIVSAELKGPWDALGRTPYNTSLVEGAHAKASRCGALYFITWNVRRLVVWKTDDPGVALTDRVIYDREIVPPTVTLASPADLDKPEIKEAINTGIVGLVSFLHAALSGPPTVEFLPLDRLFIARIESALDFPIQCTSTEMRRKLASEPTFRRGFERWMRDVQGWVVSESTESQNVDHAARFTCYVLVNRLCFYNALRRKYSQLPRLAAPNNIATGDALQRRLARSFDEAKRFTGNYETVFDGDYGDTLPFLSDEAVPEWRSLIRSLDHYDFAHIGLDVIGAMYEQLIKPAERHRYGQHYTQPSVVDLIMSFATTTGREQVLDPGCGGGTFLVRAYARKSFLDSSQDHSALLESLYGCDILNYACHLSIINLAIRDLIDDDNFPRIHLGDFLRYSADAVFSEQPVRIQAGGLVTGKRDIRLHARSCDAIVGNPPYINAKEMRAADRVFYHESAVRAWPHYSWRRVADIYTYFWLYAEQFVSPSGYLVLLTQAGWLDVDYGIPLQQWMLDHFRIVAILETEAEPWFTDARVATAVTVLQRETTAERRASNPVRFGQFRSRLSAIAGIATSEADRQRAFDSLRDRLLEPQTDIDTERYRIRIVRQDHLEEAGTERGGYVGSKWGRYLRSTETLYSLQKAYPSKFVPLRQLAHVQRGITTNRDEFFLVSDISDECLEAVQEARAFRTRFRVARERVASRDASIVRRKDGVELPLETRYLRPIIKTARDVSSFVTRGLDHGFAVVISDRRQDLPSLAKAYVEAGEREGWHQLPSFQAIQDAGGNWYSLRESDVSPILLIKTMQYSPIVLLNDAKLLANQRLYTVRTMPEVDPIVLCAVLNSTIFACERYAAVKALGREAAIDVEVFSANAYKTPDVRGLAVEDVESLRTLMLELALRPAEDMVEAPLMQLGRSAALAYVSQTPISQEIWPSELKDPVREEIDKIVLRLLGVPAAQVDQTREAMVNELVDHTRKLRLLELEARINRQGTGSSLGTSPRQLADEIWTQLIESRRLTPRQMPHDFLPVNELISTVHLPVARVRIEGPDLFDAQSMYVLRTDRAIVFRGSQNQVLYLAKLSELGVAGDVALPEDASVCRTLSGTITEYHQEFTALFEHHIAEVTSDDELATRIMKEGWKRIVSRG